MSDVDKTISGLNDGELLNKNQQLQHQQHQHQLQQQLLQQQQKAKATNIKYSNSHYSRHHSQHNQHQLQQSRLQHKQQQHQSQRLQQDKQKQQTLKNYHYNNIVAGSATLTDSTVADEAANATSASSSSSSSSTSSSFRRNCISHILKLIFSTPGLVLLVIGYSVLGAFIFPLLEAPQDITKSAAIAKSREDCLRELWIITEKLNVLYERNWTMLVHEQLRRFEGSIVAATRNIGPSSLSSGTNIQTTAVGRFGGTLDAWEQARWSFSEALLYSVTVITTIGHGNLTPKTAAGKIATILYAIIGVPLMLMCLSSLGALLAEALQCTYAKVCCRLTTLQQNERNSDKSDIKIQRQQQHQLQQGHHCCQENDKDQHDNETACHGKGQGLNCKDCKYDAIMDEEKLQKSFEYNENNCNNDSAIERCRAEEFCQLLHGSPKARLLNHNNISPCMQIKMLPQHAIAYQQYYHQKQMDVPHTQQQQQQSQPPHDATALAVPTTTTTINKTTTPTAPTSSITTFVSSSVPTTTTNTTNMMHTFATATPQHLSHTLQPTTTFHIVSNANTNSPQLISSTHSSPIHYNYQQQQQQQQQHHQLTLHQYGNNVAQHFVAIPSSMVRFQVTPTSNNFLPPPPLPLLPSSSTSSSPSPALESTTTSSSSSPNCYQPTATVSAMASTASPATTSASLASVTGAATIYFPIAGTTTTMPRTKTTTIVAGGNTAAQFLCNQPLVKYHTIQLQHKNPTTTTITTASTAASSSVAATMILNDKEQQQYRQQQQQQQLISTSGIVASNSTDMTDSLNVADDLPLPPPPAYQTATVHGVRRAKFITKPLPAEINTLLAENDVSSTSFRHDLLQHQHQQQNNTNSAMTIPTTCMTTTPSSTPASLCTIENILLLSTGGNCGSTAANTPQANFVTTSTVTSSMVPTTNSMPVAHNLTTGAMPTTTTKTIFNETQYANTLSGSNVTVDIMEDDDDDERLSNCPHGTPSRIPLLSNNADNNERVRVRVRERERERDFDKTARGLINATAASFNRHTMFQRNNNRFNRKSTLVTQHNGGNLQTSAIWTRRLSGGGGSGGVDDGGNSSTRNGISCYGLDPNADTSEDDDYLHQRFVLKHTGNASSNIDNITDNNAHVNIVHNDGNCNRNHIDKNDADANATDTDADDNDDEDDDDDDCNGNVGPQVPISIVLLILICYISLGTVIFALWENWSLIDGAYFCFVTLATIGYGDFIPERTFQGPEVQLFACCAYLLLGLVLVAMSFSILETQLMWKCKRIAVRLRLTKD